MQDNKASRHIPLSSILDALEQPADSSQDASDSDSDGHGHGPQRSGSKSVRSPSMRKGTSFMPIPGSGSSRAEGVLGSSLTSGFGTSADPSSVGGPSGSALGTSYASTSAPMGQSPSAAPGLGGPNAGGDHLFRLITAKRTYTLCAPTEEDEIKWLAGVKALLNREREKSSQAHGSAQAQGSAAGMGSPTVGGEAPALSRAYPVTAQPQVQQPQQQQQAQGQGYGQGQVPRITQQPPTPSLSPNASSVQVQAQAAQPTPAYATQRPQQQPDSPTSPTSLSGRGRSATYTAKSAVEEVVRRYHPERQAQAS